MLNSVRAHRTALGLAAVGSALALAACGGPAPADEPESTADTIEAEVEEEPADVDTGDFNQGPIPSEKPELNESDLPPEPDNSAPLGERIAWEALEQVSTFASMTDPDATYQCPDIAGEEGESVTCTVNFLGEEFEYNIDIQSSGILISYEQDLPEGPLVREMVEDTLRWDAETEYVLCDMESDLVRGRTSEDAPFTCQALDEETGDVSEYTLSISMYGAYTFYPA
ncbi:hypothetical protein PWG71_17450 [Nocardiopsis sp. N85]|uniref:hypothetical protein n=1 Tax=Nocardiopsis sp. N85 TaxID=3029400 RepID=UPI00237FA995|nr:hypothetical protein [Nocardiopsis sp. N85]MDE3723181.1 hypothetical protein [Nocardiopsis sp. N85]